MTTEKTTEKTVNIDFKAQIKGLQDSIKTLSGMGIDTTALESQLQGLQSSKVKEEFFGKIKGMGKHFLESGIKVITLTLNDDGEFSVVYGNINNKIKEGKTARGETLSEVLLYIKDNGTIKKTGPWFDEEIEKDIRGISEYKNKDVKWIKENRMDVYKGLVNKYPDKYSFQDFNKSFTNGPLNEEELLKI